MILSNRTVQILASVARGISQRGFDTRPGLKLL